MGLTMGQRKALTREMAARYRGASRPQKKAMLDEFVELHGCTRHYAGWLLRMWGKTVFERRDGELVKIWSANGCRGAAAPASTTSRSARH